MEINGITYHIYNICMLGIPAALCVRGGMVRYTRIKRKKEDTYGNIG